jgi:transcriptional regulator with XRE-family HTH domain
VQYFALIIVFLRILSYFYIKNALYRTMSLHTTIKERRAILRLTQQDLAEISGVGLRTLKEIESGKGNPSLAILNKIAEILGMEVKLVIKETNKT